MRQWGTERPTGHRDATSRTPWPIKTSTNSITSIERLEYNSYSTEKNDYFPVIEQWPCSYQKKSWWNVRLFSSRCISIYFVNHQDLFHFKLFLSWDMICWEQLFIHAMWVELNINMISKITLNGNRSCNKPTERTRISYHFGKIVLFFFSFFSNHMHTDPMFPVMVKGRTEVSRLILAHAGVAYEDVRIERDQWPALKSSWVPSRTNPTQPNANQPDNPFFQPPLSSFCSHCSIIPAPVEKHLRFVCLRRMNVKSLNMFLFHCETASSASFKIRSLFVSGFIPPP